MEHNLVSVLQLFTSRYSDKPEPSTIPQPSLNIKRGDAFTLWWQTGYIVGREHLLPMWQTGGNLNQE